MMNHKLFVFSFLLFLLCLDYVYALLNKAQRSFHEMFLRTYGIMYQKNADVFQVIFIKSLTINEQKSYL